jgi:hypothetical protein
MHVYRTYTGPLSVQAQYSRSCPIISSSCYNSSLVTWTVVCLTADKFKPLMSESYVPTDGQPASLSWSKAPIWGLRPDLYYLCDSYGLVLVGRPLWREVGSVLCICCWPLPAQSFSGPSPLGLETIFYCLTFETSLFVASYDSQGHGGGIQPRLHTGVSLLYFSWSLITPRRGPVENTVPLLHSYPLPRERIYRAVP